jgi:hypothetical protein
MFIELMSIPLIVTPLKITLRARGFEQIEDINPEEMEARYFGERTDKSRVGRLSHVIHARV